MPRKQVAYPVPVLGNGDDIGAAFTCEILFSVQDGVPRLKGKFVTDHDGIVALIEKGDAQYSLLVESRRTFYRRNFAFNVPEFEFFLPKEKMRERISIYPAVVAAISISRYAPPKLNSEFDGAKVSVAKGDLLAIAPKQEIIPDTEFMGALGDPQSIFQIKLDATLEGDQIKPYFHSDQITIKLARSVFDLYHASKSKPDIVHALIAFPTLIEAIRQLEDAQFGIYRWNVVLKALLEQHGLKPDEPLEAAQVIFGWPIKRGLAVARGAE